MAPPAKSPPSSGLPKRPTKFSRKFNTNDRVDRPSYAEPDDYFSPTKKPPRSTAYTSPLSFIDEGEALQRSASKSIPLTEKSLQDFQEAQEAESPPSDSRFSNPNFRAFMRKSKSRSPEKKKATKKKNKDQDEHPLNLPPDQLRQLSARMAKDEKRDSGQMDVDAESDLQPEVGSQNSQPPTPGSNAPGAFPSSSEQEYTNGDAREQTKSPTPPPHRVNTQPKIDPEVAKASGNKYFKSKDYGRAIAEYTKAIEAAPENATYLSNRAAAYMANYQYELALSDCLQSSYLDPDNEKILHRLARIYTFLGRPDDALSTYAKIPLASATDTASAQKAKRSIEIAEQQIVAPDGDGKMAVWNINQAKQTLGPGTPMPRKWRLLVAKANLKIGSANSLGEVQAIAQDMMRDNSMDAEAIVLLGQALYMKDDKGPDGVSDYKRADDCFKKAIQLDPDNKEAKASRTILKAMEAARSNANNLYTRKSYQAAADAYTEALKIDPKNKVTNAKLLHNRALCRMYLEDYDAAKADCNQALKLDPSYTKAKKARAKIVGNAGDWKQAVEDLKAVQEENPEDPSIARDIRDAELELKKAARKDYYKILGVSKSAETKEIERAYKKKAAILHPDKTGGDEEKEAQFKDCLEAKETLCDPQKRAAYDSGADLMEPSMGGSPFGGGFGGGGVQIDPEMLFNMMNGGMGGRGGGMGGGGGFPGGFRFSTGGPGMGGQGGFPF